MGQKIESPEVLEFAVFCLENVAQQLSVPSQRLYAAWTNEQDFLGQYVVPCYDVLQTQSRDYIVEDILSAMKEKGIAV